MDIYISSSVTVARFLELHFSIIFYYVRIVYLLSPSGDLEVEVVRDIPAGRPANPDI